MPLIADYASLRATVAEYAKRNDLTAQIPGFVQIATNRISRDLRTRQQERSITGTMTVGAQTIALPDDFVQMRRFFITTGQNNIDLEYVAPTNIEAGTGRPKTYTITGSAITLGSSPDSAYQYTVQYFQKMAQLVNDADTNVLLTYAPSIYLYATLIELAIFTMDEKQRATWSAMYERTVDDLNSADWGDGALMAVRTDTRVR